MNDLLRPRIWPSFLWRPRVSIPATYRSGTPLNQHPAVARWHAHLRDLATAIHEVSGLRACLIPGKGATYDLVFGGWSTLFYIADCGFEIADYRHFRSF